MRLRLTDERVVEIWTSVYFSPRTVVQVCKDLCCIFTEPLFWMGVLTALMVAFFIWEWVAL